MIAPDFHLHDQFDKEHTLKDYAGRWVLLYFYPKDDTPGCTTEACSFRDGFNILQEKGVVILGISKDTVASHKAFAEKYSLPFSLLADTDMAVSKAYGAWSAKQFMGKPGVLRKSFLINPEGDIAQSYNDVTPETHYDEIIADLNRLDS